MHAVIARQRGTYCVPVPVDQHRADDDLTSDLIPTLTSPAMTTGPMLRVGIRRGSAVTLNAPAPVTRLDAHGVDALIATLTEARTHLED